VPTVAAAGTQETASAIWVGIDGSSDRTVEQIGTEQDWSMGAPVYYAWLRCIPRADLYSRSFPLNP